MNILFLDDDKLRQQQFRSKVPFATIVETASDTIKKLASDVEWDIVFLDHDLNGEVYVDSDREDCGMEVVRWISASKPKVKRIICHTLNEKARSVMVQSLDAAGFEVAAIPFIWLAQSGIYSAIDKIHNGNGG